MFKRKKQDTRGAMPILILSENPEIKALDNRLTEIRENGDKKIEELQKVANRIAETVNEQSAAIWAEIEKTIRDKLPADYSHDKYSMEFKSGVLFVESTSKKCDCPLCSLVRGLQ